MEEPAYANEVASQGTSRRMQRIGIFSGLHTLHGVKTATTLSVTDFPRPQPVRRLRPGATYATTRTPLCRLIHRIFDVTVERD